jgi:very-short-patch-repair endonuclease
MWPNEEARAMRQEISPGRRRVAKALRANSTDAERKLWTILRGNRLGGLKFKRQVPLDGYILDFVCFEHKLIVEADGSQHVDSIRDGIRDAHFAAKGFRTLRFWNGNVLEDVGGMARLILEAVGQESS